MPGVPYQAYRPKRHSRNISANSFSAAATVSLVLPLEHHAISVSGNHSEGETGGLGSPIGVTESSTTLMSTPPPSSPPSSTSDLPTQTATSNLSTRASTFNLPTQTSTVKASTFRRIRHTKSPLSASSLVPRSALSPSHSRSPSIVSTPSPSGYTRLLPAIEKTLPSPDRASELRAPRLTSSTSTIRPSEAVTTFTERNHGQSSEYLDLATQTTPTHPMKSSSNSNGSVITSKPISTVLTEFPLVPTSSHMLAPYRPGFQPRGVCRTLTDDFMSLRCVHRNGEAPFMTKRVERTKLERRLEKLISLHFPLPSSADGRGMDQATSNSAQTRDRPGFPQTNTDTRRFSPAFDLDSIRSMDIWKSLMGSGIRDSIRDAEQRITPWQDDSTVNRCPLCDASFHPLTNRKHHCRLCGKIICALPPRGTYRPVACSRLFVLDPQSRIIKEIGEGVDYGVKRRSDGRFDQGSNSIAGQGGDEGRFWKGVRICRECRPVVLDRKYRQESAFVPSFVRLHDVLIDLEHEIEAALPQFQELLLSLSHDDVPTKEASAARKRLLRAFGEYDALSKQIYQLSCPDGVKSTQQHIQAAVLARANIFLQKNMFPLKSLPTGKKSIAVSKSDSFGDASPHYSEDLELAQRLQPLLEQEALLETFIEEAEARRKFEDVKTLKYNLGEIRGEIRRISKLV